MNILMIVQWFGEKEKDYFTGIFHYELAKKIQNYENIAIYFPYDQFIDEEFEYSIERGILTFRGKARRGIADIHKYIADLNKINKVFKPDVIHTNVTLNSGIVGLIGKKFFKIPFINTEHVPVEMMDLTKKGKLKTEIILSSSYYNCAVSPYLQNELNKLYPHCYFYYISNGVNNPLTYIGNDCTKYSFYKFVNCSVVAGFYSKEIKGYQYLLPAIKIVRDSGFPIHLHICGGGKFLDYYKQLAEKLEIQDNVTFYGNCNKTKLYSILSQMDFNISASIYESAGVAVQEACMLGKPQVITKSGGSDSLIPDKFSVKVETKSVESLSEGITKLCKSFCTYNKNEISRYGQENFEMETIAKQYISIYKRCVMESKM